MNLLVVFFSVVALAASSPSHLHSSPILTYSSPSSSGYISQSRYNVESSPLLPAGYAPVSRTLINGPAYLAAPAGLAGSAAYTQESRVDFKSSPGILSTVASSPVAYSAPIGAAVVAPGVISQQSHVALKTAPAVVAAPVSYSASIAAPSASSYQSRVDIKSSPAVVSRFETVPVGYSATYAGPAAISAPAASSYQSRIDIKSPALVNTYQTGPLAYSAPAVVASPASIAAPVASSYQSRVDVKTSPASVTTYQTAPIAYSAPVASAISAPAAVAAPAATSYQSRVEVKSSPAVVSNIETAPVAYRTTFAGPAAIATPAAIGAPATSYQSRVEYKSSPAVLSTVGVAPVTYNAAIATPSAISSQATSYSQQSRVDIKSSPGVVSTLATAPVAYSAAAYGTPVAAYDTRFAGYNSGVAAQTVLRNDNIARTAFVGPAYGASGVVTPDASLYLRELDPACAEGHLIRKRSVAIAPVASTYASTAFISGNPLAYAAPLHASYSTPIFTNVRAW